MHIVPRSARAIHLIQGSGDAPPRLVEYAYYFSMFYSTLGSAVGLSVEFLGAGMLAVLAASCVMHLRSRAKTVYAQVALPLWCAISCLVVQLVLHDESLMGDNVRPFVTWILALIIIQSLSLRQGFLHRFAFTAFLIGVALSPYLQIDEGGSAERVELDRTVGYANSNDLAAWFGFCAVYFAIAGIETTRNVIRMASWVIALGCLYILGLTVSRGSLFAVAISTVIALRRSLKRGFLPVLSVVILVWLAYESGLFERIATSYTARGMEETGRFAVWPLAFERFLSAPLSGVGASDIATYVPFSNKPITPHNSFLFIGLASGIVPLAFFVAYWWRAAREAFRANTVQAADAPFLIPLLVYAFLIAIQLNAPFTFPWMIVTLSAATAATASRRARRVIVRQIGGVRLRSTQDSRMKPDIL